MKVEILHLGAENTTAERGLHFPPRSQTNMKKYKINPPMGSMMIPKEIMTETEIRDFMPQLIGDAEQSETWREKAKKDPIDEVIDWLKQAGYEVDEVK